MTASVSFRLGRAVAALFRAKGAAPTANRTPPSAPPPATMGWRGAKAESATLRHAVEPMEHHASLLAQLADAWLLAANVQVTEVAQFHANVRRSREFAGLIDEPATAVVAEVRQLEQLRDRAGWFDARKAAASQFADAVDRLEHQLRARLDSLTAERSLDASALRMDAAQNVAAPERTQVDAWLKPTPCILLSLKDLVR